MRANGEHREASRDHLGDPVVLRVAADRTLLDTPIWAPAGADPWVATVWSDAMAAGGWRRRRWDQIPSTARFVVPSDVTLGTVIEFAADGMVRRGSGRVRWYGWVADVRSLHLVVVPAESAATAESIGREAVELWKHAQADASARSWRSAAEAVSVIREHGT